MTFLRFLSSHSAMLNILRVAVSSWPRRIPPALVRVTNRKSCATHYWAIERSSVLFVNSAGCRAFLPSTAGSEFMILWTLSVVSRFLFSSRYLYIGEEYFQAGEV